MATSNNNKDKPVSIKTDTYPTIQTLETIRGLFNNYEEGPFESELVNIEPVGNERR